MQLTFAIFKHHLQQSKAAPHHTPTAWDDIDATSRAAALAVLARLIAKMLSAGHAKVADNE